MYIVEIQNNGIKTPIHNSKQKLVSGKVTKGINTIDSFQFSMLPSNAGFNEIFDYTTLVTVYNTKHNRYEFFGRVLYSEDTMSEDGSIQKDVICESFFGFFCDSQQEYVAERNWSVRALLQHIISTHNSQIESYKQFTIGEVTVTEKNDNIYCGIQRENTWETLKKKLLEVIGGELRFRVDGDVIYLDYLEKIGEVSSTEITLSRNMKSISREKDPSEIVTRLIPLGCKLSYPDAEGNPTETEYRLDISSVNDGKKYIDDENAIALYGIRVATVEFDDVNVAGVLLRKGEDWLIENNKIRASYTISALDLSLLDLDADDFEVCNYYLVKNPLLGINEQLRVIKQNIDICEEYKTTMDFGDSVVSLSETLKRKSDKLTSMGTSFVTSQKLSSEIAKTQELITETEQKMRLAITDQNTAVTAALELKVDKDDNDKIVSMINASADTISLNGERIEINSPNFILKANGEVEMRKATIVNEAWGQSTSINGGQIYIDGYWEDDGDKQIVKLLNFYAPNNTLCGLYAIGNENEYGEFEPLTLHLRIETAQ